MKKFKRITIDPQKMGGVPCVRDFRMPVSSVLAMLADKKTQEDILKKHPELEVQDINEVLLYAAELLRFREIPLAVQ